MTPDNPNNSSPVTEENDDILLLEDDRLVLLDDDETISLVEDGDNPPPQHDPWKMMIVDDDRAVHQATELALKNFIFEDKPLLLFHALSGEEARKLILEHPDMAFILLDVVMETNDAGLQVVRYIREELKNKRVQIVLRTGQPGEAPQEAIIRNYEINDYKLKVELTRQRLITAAISALRAYRNTLIVEEKTAELTEALTSLQQTQLQLVQSEKMSALGNLVAGVAHEINNPVGFLQGNIQPAQDYIEDLFKLIDWLLNRYADDAEIEKKVEDIDLEFIRDDLPQILESMTIGVDRIRSISNSLRTFSRQDQDYKVRFNIDEGIESTLLILKHCTKANDLRPEIEIIRDYKELTEIKCFPGQLNQVFMNILSNAIDAFDQANYGKSYAEIEKNPNTIIIQTSIINDRLQIQIKDNGCGMKPETQKRIFEQGFTTKEVGKGTGLGMAIAHQIITEKHGGTIECQSELEKGTTFTIALPLS